PGPDDDSPRAAYGGARSDCHDTCLRGSLQWRRGRPRESRCHGGMSVASSRDSRLSQRKRVVFATVTVGLTLIVPFAALLGADIYLHGKYQRSAGVNVWGYR